MGGHAVFLICAGMQFFTSVQLPTGVLYRSYSFLPPFAPECTTLFSPQSAPSLSFLMAFSSLKISCDSRHSQSLFGDRVAARPEKRLDSPPRVSVRSALIIAGHQQWLKNCPCETARRRPLFFQGQLASNPAAREIFLETVYQPGRLLLQRYYTSSREMSILSGRGATLAHGLRGHMELQTYLSMSCRGLCVCCGGANPIRGMTGSRYATPRSSCFSQECLFFDCFRA